MFSDLHVDANDGLAVPLDLSDCDAVIVAGDVSERLSTRVLDWLVENIAIAGAPVVYTPGNHCYYGKRFPAELDRAVAAFESAGISLLARGQSVQIGDVFVVGATLWTDFRLTGDQRAAMLAASDRRSGMNDHRKIRHGAGSRPFLPSDAVREHAAAVEAITRSCRSARAAADSLVPGGGPADTLVACKNVRGRAEKFADEGRPANPLARKNAQPIAGTFSGDDDVANPSCKNDYEPAKTITRAAEPANVVVVTHHAPSPRSLRGGQVTGLLDAAYASDLESLILDLQPAAWIHGHVHRSVDYEIGRTRVVSNPLGYVTQVGRGKAARMQLENPEFDPSFTIVVGRETPPEDEAAIGDLWR